MQSIAVSTPIVDQKQQTGSSSIAVITDSVNDLRISTTLILLSLIRTTSAVAAVTPHASSIINAWLQLVTNRESLRVRTAAIDGLEAVSSGLPYATVYPHRTAIINGLGLALNDSKRAVRKAAAKCRNEWFVLAAPS